MIASVLAWLRDVLDIGAEQPEVIWNAEWSAFLQDKVAFYRGLNEADKRLFEKRVMLFLQTTRIEAGQFEVTEGDCLLVAASAIIPVWGFPKWHYFNLEAVFLLPAAFNNSFQCGKPDSLITGMVGDGPMSGKLVLSKPALYQGFENSRDKHSVGIHEFVHLVDMADGECDGYPEGLKQFAFSIPWFDLVRQKTKSIENRKSNIGDYGAFNRQEFFAVASEYFFERPAMLKKKHPELYRALSDFYRQDVMHIEESVKPKRKAPCPCGSGKRYKHCCMPEN